MSVTYCPQISYYHFSITYYSALYLLSNWLFSPFMEYDFWSQGTHLVHNSISLTSWHKVGYQHRHLLFLFSSFQIDVDPLENIFQFSSVTQSCSTLCDPTNHSTPGFPVHHQLLEFTQTHVHWVGDAIQLSHPLLSPSPPAFNLSQHQGLFKWVSSSHQVAKVLEFQLQH